MVASRKTNQINIKHPNDNYVLRIRKRNEEEDLNKREIVKRRSNLFDKYSSETQHVERRKRTKSTSNTDKTRPTSLDLDINAIQEICMVDIKTQLLELTKKVNKLIDNTDLRLNQIEKIIKKPP